MTEQFLLPALGESVGEATVTRWLKAVGDPVEEGEALLEVATDKVDTEVESDRAGVLLEILVDEDRTVDVGTPLARIGAAGAAPVPAAPANDPVPVSDTVPAESSRALAPVGTSGPPLTFLVRSLLRTANLPPDDVVGTGPGGRITPGDVRAKRPSVAAPASAAIAAVAAVPASAPAPTSAADEILEASNRTAQLTTAIEVELPPEVDPARDPQRPVSADLLTWFAPRVLRAAGQALLHNPIVAARDTGDSIGFADTDELYFHDPAGVWRRVPDATAPTRAIRAGLAGPASDPPPGAFRVVTSPEGVIIATALVRPPALSVLTIGTPRPRPVVIGDGLAIATTITLALSYDHRIVDGADAARYLTSIAAELRSPDLS